MGPGKSRDRQTEGSFYTGRLATAKAVPYRAIKKRHTIEAIDRRKATRAADRKHLALKASIERLNEDSIPSPTLKLRAVSKTLE